MLGLSAAAGSHRREPEAQTPSAPLLYSGATAAVAQLLAGKPTRAVLAWSNSSPLTPYPDVERELTHCQDAIAFDGEEPAGSLAKACGVFRSMNGLRPMGAACAAGADPAQKLAVRRLLLNDALHVLLDFASDWRGQLGVFSFVAAQRYCPQFERAARTLGQAYMTAAPWLRADLAAAEARGRQLASSAPRLLTMPLEREWGAPLTALQVKANLRPVKSLGAIDWSARALSPAPRAGLERRPSKRAMRNGRDVLGRQPAPIPSPQAPTH